MIDKQVKQKAHHDGQKPLREFTVNDKVYVENFPTKKPRWISGTIVKVTGPLLYEVELESGVHVQRHVDNVRRREENPREKQNSEQESSPPMLLGPQLSSETERTESIQLPENPDRPGTVEPREQ